MRLLVFSDVHANATALEAAFEACAGRWERAVCLGDVVGYGPDPNEVVERVRSLVSGIVRGNHDKAVSGISNLEDFNPVARVAIEWTRSQASSGEFTLSAESSRRADRDRRGGLRSWRRGR